MHLEGPWLTTTGKVKSKRRKFASAEAARKARELTAEWEERQKEWAKLSPRFSKKPLTEKKVSKPFPSYAPPPGRETPKIASLNGGVDSGPALKVKDKVYTGDAVLGISTLHKSNAVPVFSKDEAVSISKMRR